MSNPTKEELALVLNEFLGTDIQFTKLSKEELVELASVINNPDIICRDYLKGIKENEDPKEKVITGLVDMVKNFDGPIIRKLKQIATDPDKVEK